MCIASGLVIHVEKEKTKTNLSLSLKTFLESTRDLNESKIKNSIVAMADDKKVPPTMEEIHQKMISSFITKITSYSRDVARLFLEAHQWDIDAAVSDFNQVVSVAAARRNVPNPRDRDSRALPSNLGVDISVSSPPPIRLRSPRSPSHARNLFSREAIQRADNDFHEQE
ncbi:hypothetical protein YC2023_054142 [Brassica napus]